MGAETDMDTVKVKIESTTRLLTRFSTSLQPQYVTLDKGAIGQRAVHYGASQFSIENAARALAWPGAITAAQRILCDYLAVSNMLKAVLPNNSARIELRDPIIVDRAIQRYMAEKVSSYITEADGLSEDAKGNLSDSLADMILTIIGPLGFIRPTVGMVHLEPRTRLFPDFEELRRDQRAITIEALLNKAISTIDLGKARKITLPVLDQIVSPVLRTLGEELMDVAIFDRHFQDTMKLVRAYVMKSMCADEAEIIPENLRSDSRLMALAQNVTILNAAMTMHHDRQGITTPLHLLESAIKTVYDGLNASKRYETRSLLDLAKMFTVKPVRQSTGKLIGVVVAKNLAGDSRTQVTQFLEIDPDRTGWTQLPFRMAEEIFNSMLGTTLAGLQTKKLAGIAETLLSFAADELEDRTAICICTNAEELRLLAMAHCRDVRFGYEDNGSPELVVRYGADLSGVHMDTNTPLWGNQSLITDPLEFLMLIPGYEGSALAPTRVQTIPEEDRKRILRVSDLDSISTLLTKNIALGVNLARKEHLTINTSIPDLLGMDCERDLRVTNSVVNRALGRSLRKLLNIGYALAREVDRENAHLTKKAVMDKTTFSVANLLVPLVENPITKGMTKNAVYRALQVDGLSKEARGQRRTDLEHLGARLQLKFGVALAVLNKLSLISKHDAQQIVEALAESKYFADAATTFGIDIGL